MVEVNRQVTQNPEFMKIKIRDADYADIADMSRLEHMCFDIEAFSVHQLKYLIGTRTAISLAAMYEGKFAGFIIGITNRNRYGTYGRVYTLDVDGDFRRLGVATSLISALMVRMREAGCSRCFLEVRLDNDKAIALYEKLGFVKTRIIFNYYSRGVHAIKMRKELR